jgi:hypothetical protein
MDENKVSEMLNLMSARITTVEKQVKHMERNTLAFRMKNRWDRFFSVIYVILSSAQGPTFLTRVKMMLQTMYRFAMSGFKLEETQKHIARFEICKACPELVQESGQCKQCGCFMAKKVKIAAASCPLKKW